MKIALVLLAVLVIIGLAAWLRQLAFDPLDVDLED